MKYIAPISITSDKVSVTSSVSDAAPAWSASATYSINALVKYGERIYKSLQNGNLNKAVTDEAWWSNFAPSNKMAMFDGDVSTFTASANSLVVDITSSPIDILDSVALVGVYADAIKLDVIFNNTVTHTQTIKLVRTAIDDWYQYFFAADIYDTRAIFTIPLTSLGVIRLTFTGANIKVGHCIAGLSKSIGTTRLGGSKDLVDYSKASSDEFGAWTLTRRNFTSNGSFSCEVDRDSADAVFNDLAAMRGVPTLWTGVDDDPFTVIFGILGKVRGDLATRAIRYFTVEVKGMAT